MTLFDTPTAKACGILSSTTTARCLWSDTVSLSVRRPKSPRSRVPRGTDLASQSPDCLNSSLGGELGSRTPTHLVPSTFYPAEDWIASVARFPAGTGNVAFSKSGPSRDNGIGPRRHAFIPPLKGVGFRLTFCKNDTAFQSAPPRFNPLPRRGGGGRLAACPRHLSGLVLRGRVGLRCIARGERNKVSVYRMMLIFDTRAGSSPRQALPCRHFPTAGRTRRRPRR